MKLNTLKRSELLKSEKSITELFETGHSLFIYPVRLVFKARADQDISPIKVGFSVSKKNFKRAVDRNLIKRRMREGYRLNKQILFKDIPNDFRGLDIMFLYQGKSVEDFDKIRDCQCSLLNKLLHKIY